MDQNRWSGQPNGGALRFSAYIVLSLVLDEERVAGILRDEGARRAATCPACPAGEGGAQRGDVGSLEAR